MSPPASKIICPGCRAAFDASTNYCSRCGSSLGATPAEERVRKTERALRLPEADSAVEADPLIGRVIDSRYKVIERLASGGMGVVYKVEHQRMGKIAAMKVLHRDLAGDAEVMKRFKREAQAVSKLTHPNTVQTFDFGTAEGAMYLVMEYVRGDDLGALLRRDGPMPFRRVAPIFMQVCDALAEAHELGIVHRDVKPENILVIHGKDGHDHAKVLDFGLAKMSVREEGPADATGRGTIVGTPYYMSPEQIRGDELDGRSDIYSLGAVMYRVVTGEPPFQSQSPMGVLTKHLTDDLVLPTERRPDLGIPAVLDRIVGKAMAREREDRYPTVEALRTAIADALAESGASVRATSAPLARGATPQPSPVQGMRREDFDAFERSLRMRSWVRLLILPIVLGGAATAVVTYVRHQRQQPREVEVEPNNDLMTATLIAPGKPVRGKIAQRLSPEEGDRDFYRVELGGGATQVVAEVSAIPNINLTLVLFDEKGNIVVMADGRRVGEGESLSERVTGKAAYLAVLERKGAARVPTENLSDEYALTVRVEPR